MTYSLDNNYLKVVMIHLFNDWIEEDVLSVEQLISSSVWSYQVLYRAPTFASPANRLRKYVYLERGSNAKGDNYVKLIQTIAFQSSNANSCYEANSKIKALVQKPFRVLLARPLKIATPAYHLFQQYPSIRTFQRDNKSPER